MFIQTTNTGLNQIQTYSTQENTHSYSILSYRVTNLRIWTQSSSALCCVGCFCSCATADVHGSPCSHAGLLQRADVEDCCRLPSGRWWWCQGSSQEWSGRGRDGRRCERCRSSYLSPVTTPARAEFYVSPHFLFNKNNKAITKGTNELLVLSSDIVTVWPQIQE